MPSLSQTIRPALPSDAKPSSCDICLEPFSKTPNSAALTPTKVGENPMMIIACGHVFGENCLAAWTKIANTCPLCRAEISPEILGTEEGIRERMRRAFVGSLFVRLQDEYAARLGTTTRVREVQISTREVGSNSEGFEDIEDGFVGLLFDGVCGEF